jgi:hypothetical protein
LDGDFKKMVGLWLPKNNVVSHLRRHGNGFLMVSGHGNDISNHQSESTELMNSGLMR